MLALKLAYLNLKGAGIRTWLNVIVLSLSYVLIIWTQGLYRGMNEQASQAMIAYEIGGGQFWYKSYDPYDPLTIEDSHGVLPDDIVSLIQSEKATPILIHQGVIYPEGRVLPILIKGIDPNQKILKIPSESLIIEEDILPLVIGRRMSESTSLNIDDFITIRWRDKFGTFDAMEGKVVKIMDTEVQSIDSGQIWVPLKRLREMTLLNDEATVIVVSKDEESFTDSKYFIFKDHAFLLSDLRAMVRTKSVSASFMYIILLFLAMIAIFDTQILSVFKRRKEIGTLIALGMTRKRVVYLFTLEGAMHGLLSFGFAALYGLPLLIVTRLYGFKIPKASESFGFAISDRLFPVYGAGLITGTTLIIMITVTVVSYLPSSKIAALRPTDALKGKVT